MPSSYTVTLPKLGESIQSAQVVAWLKKEGEKIRRDEPLCEVTTDKVNSEIPSPFDGILKEILAPVETQLNVGDPLALLLIDDEVKEEKSLPQIEEPFSPSSDKNEFLSPAVLRLAKEKKILIEDLKKLKGTGEGGRLTKKDLEAYRSTPISSGSALHEEVERIPMSGMRKAIAENMSRSFYEAPHASVVLEVDVTDLVEYIAKEKEAFLAAHGVKLTVTSFLIQAVTTAIKEYPLLNASLEKETIVMKRYVNLGLAVHVEGGLLVPVIKNCEKRDLVSIAKAVSDLSGRAREKKITPDEVKEGTFTLTNFGMTGALIGVPIIRHPEVAIIGVGTIQKRVMVKEDNSFAVRQMLYLTLTFDHRVIDGIYGCQFLSAVKKNLEKAALD